MTDQTENKSHFIVGIGASAGGLEALTQLVSALPRNLNCSLVVIQHLSPNYRSMMVELLARETKLTVAEAVSGEKPKPGTIYIAPPKWDLVIKKGKLSLLEPNITITPKPSVNRFFTSLADERGESSISVVLSGTGTDGAVGSKAIKANGGITFAQEPDTAKYSGMPLAAINTGVIDRILPPHQIAEEIARLASLEPSEYIPEFEESESERLRRLFRLLRNHTKIDFSGYKKTTLWRRIHRRIATNNLKSFMEYMDYIDNVPAELEYLSKDILISVTAFFRDPEVFKALELELKKRLAHKKPGDEIRFWVPGCATGEEAFTLSMILHRILGDDFSHYQIQIFATDIDLDALDVARKATYPATALEVMDQQLIDQYFVKLDHEFQVVKEIRDAIVFARQDIVLDPPFLRLDLVSFRNLMIYFDNALQEKVLRVINYALLDGGLLSLGRSESVSQNESSFVTVNSKTKLFSSIRSTESNLSGQDKKMERDIYENSVHLQRKPHDFDSLFASLVNKEFIPPTVMVDAKQKIVKIHGDVGDYVRFSPGKPDLDITKLLVADMGAEVLSMLHNARKKFKTVKGRRRRIKPGVKGLIQIIVNPVRDDHSNELFFLISFLIVSSQRKIKSDPTGLSHKALEDELAATKEHLQTISEELETSNEELQALNEEVQASNEELQASNEELEASNEELQATNEELVTVNEEMMVKSAELSGINSDFAAVHNSLNFPVVVLDTNLHVSRINNSCRDYLTRLLPPLGHPMKNIAFDDVTLTISQIHDVQNKQLAQMMPVTMNECEYQLHLVPCADQLGIERGVIISLIDQHELIRSEKNASKAQNFLMSIMDNSVSLISVKDVAGRYEFANQAFLDRFELTEVKGKTDTMLFPEKVSRLFRQNDLNMIEKLEPVVTEEQISWKNETLLLESVRFPLLDDEGVAYAICTQSMDRSLERESRDQLRLAANVFDRAAEGILVTDTETNIVSINDAFTRITGYELNDLKGKKVSVLSSGKHNEAFYKTMWEKIDNAGWWQGEIWNKNKNNQIYPEWLTISKVNDEHGELLNYLGIFSDITVMKDSQLKAEFLATHDDLTGLPNRALLNDRIKHALSRAERVNGSLFVMFCDLDDFKKINDTLGHKTGDKLLIEAAQRLLASVRAEDTVARLGGDEFVILIEEADIKELEIISHRILDYLSASFKIDNNDLFVSSSIGISKYPDDGNDSETLMKNADAAMYRSKEMGKNRYTYFAAEMRYESQRRLAVELGLRLALENNGFHLLYQPLINHSQNGYIGCEALLRWSNSDFQGMGPTDFIPIAEQSGLMKKIDYWVIDKVLSDIAESDKQHWSIPVVHINISGQLFNSLDLVVYLKDRLALHKLDSSRIILEITENALIQSLKSTASPLEAIRELGIRIAIDDFGTGYSSLEHLEKLPIDFLKIDQTFIQNMPREKGKFAITRAIVSLGQALDLSIVAEGVEDKAQLEILKQIDCHYVQGFLFARPIPLNELQTLIQQQE